MKKIIKYGLWVLLIIASTTGCDKDKELPAISRTVVKSHGPDYAIVQGRIYVEGSSPIQRCGVCWTMKSTAVADEDLMEFPALDQSSTQYKEHETNEPGLINMRIDGLEADTVYYASFFAENSQGVYYSYPARFHTNGIPEGFVFVETTDGFLMGNVSGQIDEMPVHSVLFERNFFMKQTPVTAGEFAAFLNGQGVDRSAIYDGKQMMDPEPEDSPLIWDADTFRVKTGMENKPMAYVTWYGASEYARLSGGYLPTEAEWEYAACGGKNRDDYLYAGSDSPADCGWFVADSGDKLQDAGLKKANTLNLFDMSGNVMEWCADWYDENYYGDSVEKDPEGPSAGAMRVIRGGAYNTEPATVTSRFAETPEEAKNNIGFRIIFK